ncbi:hypothetical protein F2Q69_00010907 [Brassica cretica]|uniref:Uncharacterized protein n=1 Tax=Brassica cretica TaxID=69181 RepID=A0A8S9QWS7_BRACR|nr:hypothetical protein F2Q69_00010907 [Brassica cretica]
MFLSHSALTTIRESRLVFVHNGGLKFLVEAAKVGNFASRERERESLSRYWIDWCHQTGKLLAGNALGIIAAQTEYIRPVNEAGSIPLYVELLSGGHPMGKDIAEDVFCILAVAEGTLSVIRDSGVSPLLVALVRDGSLEFREMISGAISQLCYNDREAFSQLCYNENDHRDVQEHEHFKDREAISQLCYNENDLRDVQEH